MHSKHPWFSGLGQHFMMPRQSLSSLHSHRLLSVALSIIIVPLGQYPGFHPGRHLSLWPPAPSKPQENLLEERNLLEESRMRGRVHNLLAWQRFSSFGLGRAFPDVVLPELLVFITYRMRLANWTDMISLDAFFQGQCCFQCWFYRPVKSSNGIYYTNR